VSKYAWGDGKGAVHSRPKKTQQPPSPFVVGVAGGWSHTKGGQAKLAAGLAGPISAQTVGGPPLDPAQASYDVTAQRNLGLAQGEQAYQQGQVDYNYGYGAGGAANPYSRAALLQESFKRNVLGTTNSMAASGQQYSGSSGRAQDENARRYSIQSDANRRAYDDATHGLSYNTATSAANTGIGMSDGSYQSILKALGLA
jgi:hypothetical protein